MPKPADTQRHAREAKFHDAWADGTALDAIAVTDAFEAITAQENRFIMQLLGDVRGKTILDVGTGLGESAIYFAQQGAQVTAVDISPKMIGLCERNAARHDVHVRGLVTPAESLSVEPDSFDVVYAANILHHIQDRERFLANISAALKPGGLFVAWDPLEYNPVINVYRRMATDVRTEDEAPLTRADLRRARGLFPDLRYRTFWLTTLSLFLKYYLIDRRDPNEVRYWKAILAERPDTIGWWFRPLQQLDALLLRLPLVRWLAWNVVQWGHRPVTPPAATT